MKKFAKLLGAIILAIAIPAYAGVTVTKYPDGFRENPNYVTTIRSVTFLNQEENPGKLDFAHTTVDVTCLNEYNETIVVRFTQKDFHAGMSLAGLVGKRIAFNVRVDPIEFYIDNFSLI